LATEAKVDSSSVIVAGPMDMLVANGAVSVVATRNWPRSNITFAFTSIEVFNA
jgi:hypothetical protein